MNRLLRQRGRSGCRKVYVRSPMQLGVFMRSGSDRPALIVATRRLREEATFPKRGHYSRRKNLVEENSPFGDDGPADGSGINRV